MSRQSARNPKSLADLPIGVLEGLCLWGIYRSLGFEAADIYAGLAPVANMEEGTVFPFKDPRAGELVPADCLQVIITLRAQDREFIVNYPEPTLTQRQFIKLWAKAAKLWKKAHMLERRALIRFSGMHDNLVGLLFGLHEKGFVFPFCDGDVDAVVRFLQTEPEA